MYGVAAGKLGALGPGVGWAYVVSVIDCHTRETGGWDLSARRRTEEALAAGQHAVLERLSAGSRGAGLTLTTDNGTQFSSARFLETVAELGITHRRTAYHHPEGNSYIERFQRSLKVEEVWVSEYLSLEEARASIARYLWSTITTGRTAAWTTGQHGRPLWALKVT